MMSFTAIQLAVCGLLIIDILIFYFFFSFQFPDHGLNRLTERLLLFRHDYSSKNLLLPINVVSEITEGSLIEIVVSGKVWTS